MALPEEPDRWMAAAGLCAATTLAALGAGARRLAWARWPLFWLLAFALGFVWAMVRADMQATPRLALEGAGDLVGVAGWVEAEERRPRLVLEAARFESRGETIRLDRARVRLAGGPIPAVGDRVRVRAVMRPPPPPVAPGGYDFQRKAYFEGIGAVGFAIGDLAIEGQDLEAAGRFAALRAGFRAAVYRALPDRPDLAGVIAALTVGDRSGVDEADATALRESGLAHLLAISGLHLGMVAGAVYLALRLAFALPHGLALRAPAHKLAAVGAILAAVVYLGLSGAAPPAQRAFVMVVAAMVAILTDRLRSGMWFIAWAAVAVTLAAPHVVVGPSFQLSFAAAAAIVAAYEVASDRRRLNPDPPFGWFGGLRPVAAYVAGIAGASILATAATTLLALAHFQQAPTYGLVANLAAMPAMAFLVMPMAILAGCLAPFGLADLPLMAMAWGVDFVLWAAHLVAGWPGDVVRAPASPGWVVAAFMGGGAILCALRGRIRLIGLLGPAVAFAGLVAAAPPDVLVADDGRLAGVVREGTLYVTSERRGKFEAEVWTRLVGASAVLPLQSADPAWARCDERGCAVTLGGKEVALSFAEAGLAEDCTRAAVVVPLHSGRVTAAMGCAPETLVVDGRARARNGAHALRIADGRIRVETVRQMQGDRLWSGWRADDDP